jgi:hypothetical protein
MWMVAMMSDEERGRPVIIEYIGKRPVRVYTERADGGTDGWHLTESKRDGVAYVERDGSWRVGEPIELHGWADRSKRHPVWVAPGVKVVRFLRHARKGENSPVYGHVTDFAKLGMKRIKQPLASDPFEDTETLEYESLSYCRVCEYMSSDNLCSHLRWCDNGLCGPGCDEIDGYDDVPDGFKRVVRLVGCARALRRQLRKHERAERFITAPLIGTDSIDLKIDGRDFSRAANRLHDAGEGADIREGIVWLLGLDKDTRAANKIALSWLNSEIAEQDERRKSGAAEYKVVVGDYSAKTIAKNASWADALRAVREYKTTEKYRERIRIVHRKPRTDAA